VPASQVSTPVGHKPSRISTLKRFAQLAQVLLYFIAPVAIAQIAQPVLGEPHMPKEIFEKQILVFGCGNPLFGDDGFGPELIAYLESNRQMPDHVLCLDVGTSIRDILFDILLSDRKPEQILIVDAADRPGAKPGEVLEIDVDDISPEKASDFSLHQFPTTNMLKEIHEQTSIRIRVLVVQTGPMPDRVAPGLSPAVAGAVPRMAERIMDMTNPTTTHSAHGGAHA
jgi:coenzyme F420 hydrogenase subunit delta